jgi:hypothetical protein
MRVFDYVKPQGRPMVLISENDTHVTAADKTAYDQLLKNCRHLEPQSFMVTTYDRAKFYKWYKERA